MARGIEFFEKTNITRQKPEFDEVLKIDPKHREAKDYLEKINEILEEKMLFAQRQKQAEDAYRSGMNNMANNSFDEAQDDLEACLALVKDYKDAVELLKNIGRLRKEFEQKERSAQAAADKPDVPGRYHGVHAGELQGGDRRLRADALPGQQERARQGIPPEGAGRARIEEEESVDENSPYYEVIAPSSCPGNRSMRKGYTSNHGRNGRAS